MKNIIKEYVQAETKYKAVREDLSKKIDIKKAQIVRLEKRQTKAYYSARSWIDMIIRPIAEQLLPEYPGRHYEILGPFGLTCTVSIHFTRDNEQISTHPDSCLSISFRPMDLTKGEIRIVDYTKNTQEYNKNTLGDINGMNYPTIKLPSKLKDLKPFIN